MDEIELTHEDGSRIVARRDAVTFLMDIHDSIRLNRRVRTQVTIAGWALQVQEDLETVRRLMSAPKASRP